MQRSKALLVGVLLVVGLTRIAQASADVWSAVGPMAESRAAVSPQATVPAPTITHLRQSHRRWSDTKIKGRVQRKSRPARGTRFSFVLNEPATVELLFVKHVRGHAINDECVIETRGRSGRPCVRPISEGDISVAGEAGENTVPFEGRTSRSRSLLPGSYTLKIKATNTVDQSATRDIGFMIL